MIAAPRDDLRMPALHLQEAPGSDHQHPRHLQAEERSGASRGLLSRAGKFEETRVRASLRSRSSATSGCGDGSSAETHPTAQPRGEGSSGESADRTRYPGPGTGANQGQRTRYRTPTKPPSSANFARRGGEGAPTSARCCRTALRSPPPPPSPPPSPLLRAAAAARAAVGEAAGGRASSPRQAPSAAAGVCGRMRARGPCQQPRSGAICGPSGGGAAGRAGR